MEPLYNYTKHPGKYESIFSDPVKMYMHAKYYLNIYSYCDLLSDG